MRMKTILLFLACVAASAACALDINVEGRWLVDGKAQTNVTSTCTLRLYGAAGSGGGALAVAQARFATDSSGYFVVCASMAEPEGLGDTFWVGVTPEGRAEIVPHFRVSPVPFALAADEAALVRRDGPITLDGTATVQRVEMTGSLSAKDFTLAQNARIETKSLSKDLKLGNVRLTKVTLANAAMLGFFNDGGAAPAYDFDSFTTEKSISAVTDPEWEGSFSSLDLLYIVHSVTRSMTWRFDSDGILMVALKVDPKKCPPPLVAVKVGTEQILYGREFGVRNGGVVKRFMTIPYRAGEEVAVTVQARGLGAEHVSIPLFGSGDSVDNYKASVEAKVRLLRFGRE